MKYAVSSPPPRLTLYTLRHDDASLRWLREQYGAGSMVERAVASKLVSQAACDIVRRPRGEWVEAAQALRRREPELGARVLSLVRGTAAREVMAAVGAWLERVAPCMFEEVRDGDE